MENIDICILMPLMKQKNAKQYLWLPNNYKFMSVYFIDLGA